MTLHTGAGARLTKAALSTTPVVADPKVTVNVDVYADKPLRGAEKGRTMGRRLLWNAGDVVRQSVIDAEFGAAVIDTVTPATGPIAGGTVLTIKGSGFDNATGVTFGGTAGTAFSVVSDTEIKVTTPARAAGAVAVVVTHDGANGTKAAGFTFA